MGKSKGTTLGLPGEVLLQSVGLASSAAVDGFFGVLGRFRSRLSRVGTVAGGCHGGAGDAIGVQMVALILELAPGARGANGVLRPAQEYRRLGDVERSRAV